ncbi:MAG TPA: tetratricopeptide repeat protein, partial [Planctomycetota bacterium]
MWFLFLFALINQDAPPSPPSLRLGDELAASLDEESSQVRSTQLDAAYGPAPVVGRSFRVIVTEDAVHRIELHSHDFDAYLVLRDAQGTVIGEDDDGGVGRHARVVATLKAGHDYRVTACALHGDRSDFRLRLAMGPPPDLDDAARFLAERADAGRFAEAQPPLERVLEIHRRLLGAMHPALAGGVNNLAALLAYQGQFEQARPLFEQALAIAEASQGADHPATAFALNNLAGLLRAQGHFELARPLIERGLAIRMQVFGADHPVTAESLNTLGELLAAQGLHEEAIP